GDNVVVLPLLYWASSETGSARYTEIALEHARQTSRHLIRENGRTYHTCFVDERGQFVRAMTHQGAGHESCWSRGQAWAILGVRVVAPPRQSKRGVPRDFAPCGGLLPVGAARRPDRVLGFGPERHPERGARLERCRDCRVWFARVGRCAR
ncbi:MAG: hypothetical protein HC933_19230, partial [Pleurocapsa sp. SU_196_0]|nr:hypothetical protein [Pleurocapsa sp. SU_196_0]